MAIVVDLQMKDAYERLVEYLVIDFILYFRL